MDDVEYNPDVDTEQRENARRLALATVFTLQHRDPINGYVSVTIERRDPKEDSWTVKADGYCVSRTGCTAWEASPSNRTKPFLNAYRMTLEEAWPVAEKAMAKFNEDTEMLLERVAEGLKKRE